MFKFINKKSFSSTSLGPPQLPKKHKSVNCSKLSVNGLFSTVPSNDSHFYFFKNQK